MKTTIAFLFLCLVLLGNSAGSAVVPSLLKSGSYYLAVSSCKEKISFEVIAIGEEGWIQIRKEEKTLWLNTNALYTIEEIPADLIGSVSLHRKQMQTMADMRAIGTTCEVYAVDNNVYPAGQRLSDIVALVEPIYIKKLPLRDAWGNEFIYLTDSEMKNYWIISYGADGRKEERVYGPDGKPIEEEKHSTNNPNSDIIFSSGSFLRFPENAERDDY